MHDAYKAKSNVNYNANVKCLGEHECYLSGMRGEFAVFPAHQSANKPDEYLQLKRIPYGYLLNGKTMALQGL
jgi:hypothetical protein